MYTNLNNKFMEEQSYKYQFNKTDGEKIGRVFLWLLASTTISFCLTILPQIDLQNFAFLVPIVNMVLITGQRLIKSKGY